ncbi:MAG: DUF6702 family protein, partial [Pyrinomonadaceae bacterium]
TTMFVEVKEIDSIEKLELQNKLFFESFAEQVNLVTLHTEDKKLDLAFKVGDGFKPFVTENPKFRGKRRGLDLPLNFGVR